ncbi:U1 snRNP protein, partial [Coemansia sp. RSA 1933]
SNQPAETSPGSAIQQTADVDINSSGSPQSSESSSWVEYITPDGRAYYFNRTTQKTTWEKPDELKTPLEKNSVWKEYMKDGRPYWYNTVTKDSTWERPTELGKAVQTAVSKGPAIAASPDHAINKADRPSAASPPQAIVPDMRPPAAVPSSAQPLPAHSTAMPGRAPAPAPAQQFRPPPPVPPAGALAGASGSTKPQRREYRTPEDAECAFMDMLKTHGVCGDWTWEQALRAVVNDPDYRALKTLSERKDAFQKYISVTREAEDQNKRLVAKKRREDFNALLDSLPVCEVTRFGKIRHLALALQQDKDGRDAAFFAVQTEAERIKTFNTYVDEMAHELKAARRQLRSEQIKVVDQSLDDLKMAARWEDTKPRLIEQLGNLLMPILSSTKEERIPMDQPYFYRLEKYSSAHNDNNKPRDPEGGLSLLDFMDAFDSAIKRAEKREADLKQREKEKTFRQERLNRDAFRLLLKEHSDNITPSSTWSEFYPLIKTDQRYTEMLGQPGSTPLEMFWDEVEILSEGIYHERKALESVMRAESFRVNVDTPLADVKAFADQYVRDSDRPSSQNIEHIYNQLVSRAKRKKEEDDERLARQQRRLLDEFKYALYDLEPELDPESSTWVSELPRIRKLPEFKDIDDESACKEVFELVIERQRERSGQKRRRHWDESHKRSGSPDNDDATTMKRQKDRRAAFDEAATAAEGLSSDLEEGEMVL